MAVLFDLVEGNRAEILVAGLFGVELLEAIQGGKRDVIALDEYGDHRQVRPGVGGLGIELGGEGELIGGHIEFAQVAQETAIKDAELAIVRLKAESLIEERLAFLGLLVSKVSRGEGCKICDSWTGFDCGLQFRDGA